MSKRTSDRGTMLSAVRSLGLAAALLAMLGLSGTRAAFAQEDIASPVASPTTGDCVANEGEPPAMTAEEATPAAGEEATEPEGTPVEGEEADAAIAAIENFVHCYNAGDFESVLTLVTDNFIETELGFADRDEAAEMMGEMMEAEQVPQFTLLSADNVQSYDDDRLSVDAVYLQGEYQYVDSTIFLVMNDDDELFLDAESYNLPQPEGDSTVVGVSIADDTTPLAFDQAADEETGNRTITPFEVINIFVTNSGAEAHNIVVLRTEEGAVGTPVAEGGVPEGDEFVGQLMLDPGEQATMALLNLPEGEYVIFDPAVEGSAVVLAVAAAEEA
ncbi:MAG: hypothetical protein M3Q03_11920 [Chloroflexota bacterium]|nr:hypothetical protein [Chloroflexota bacterium]